MVTDIEGVPEFSFRKERHIVPEEVNAEAKARAETEISTSMVETVFDQVDSLLGKADILDAEIARTANPFIPVHADADEVRLALRSLYPGLSEDRISLDQYLASLDFLGQQADIDPAKLGDMMTGHDIVDSRLLSREMTEAVNSDMAPEELILIGGQFLVLAVCNRMLQTFQAPNTQQAVAAKTPPGTEAVSTLMQFIIGLAAILLQTAVNEREVKQVLSESFGDALDSMNTDVDAVVTEAKGQGSDGLMGLYGRSRTEEHQAAIRQYSTDYVAATDEPGYEPWVGAAEVRDIRADLIASRAEGESYLGTVGALGMAPYTMSSEIYKLMVCRNMGVNKRFDKLAAVLSSKYTQDLVCCFVRFFGSLPTEMLKPMRLMLKVAANGISLDLGAAMNSTADSLNAHLERKVLEPVMHAVDNFFRKSADDILKFLDPGQHQDPEAFETLLICTPIDEAFTYMLSAMGRIRSFIAAHIRRYWSRLELKATGCSVKLEVLADSKKARVLLRLLDTVIAALDKGSLCAQGDERTPSPEDVQGFIEQITKGLPPAIQIQTDGTDPYKTFSAEAIRGLKTAEGLDVLRPMTADDEHGLRDCARARITDHVTAAFIRPRKRPNRE